MFSWLNNLLDNRKLEKIHSSLTNSFNNIKKDIDHLKEQHNLKKEEHDLKISELHNSILLLENKVANIISIVSRSNSQTINKEEDYDIIILPEDIKTWDTLTTVQQDMFKVICTELEEAGKRSITMREFSRVYYPDKDYGDIRSLISTYTDKLEELGLIKKMRKGRDVYLVLTKKGEKHKKIILKKLKEGEIV